jgi:hypothetical protein
MFVLAISSLCFVRACHAGELVKVDMAARINALARRVIVSTRFRW